MNEQPTNSMEELKGKLKEMLDEYYDYSSMDGIDPIELEEEGISKEDHLNELREGALSLCESIDPKSVDTTGKWFDSNEDVDEQRLRAAVKKIMPEYYSN